MNRENIFTVGGTVQAANGLYISRHADAELLALCRERSFAYVLTPRQLGKSSLMVRTAQQLKAEGIRSVIIDLSGIGVQVTAEKWYVGLLSMMEEHLSLNTDALVWWQEREHLGVTQRLTKFFEEVLLKEVDAPVVVFVDEIDTTLSLDFTDDFFAAIRYFYNARALSQDVRRLSFVLIGVATPGDLIRDPQRTPFNIGQRVDLTDFTFEEALPLAAGLSSSDQEGRQVLRWVMKWTGGHPYLTQRLCRALADQRRSTWSESEVDQIVISTFFGEKSKQDTNLEFVRDMLSERVPATIDVADVLTTYRDVRRGRDVADEEQSLIKSHLKLSGIVCRERANLRVRNPIYAEVFDARWAKEHLPVNWKRMLTRYAAGTFLTLLIIAAALTPYAWSQKVKAETQTHVAENALRQEQAAKENLKATNDELARSVVQARSAKLDAENFARQAGEAEAKARKAKEEADKLRVLAEKNSGAAEAQSREAEAQSKNAVNSTQIATSREIAASAVAQLPTDPELSLLLSTEALEKFPQTDEAEDALKQALAESHIRSILSADKLGYGIVAFSPDGKYVLSENRYQAVAWEVANAQPVKSWQDDKRGLQSVAFSPDGKLVLTATDKTTWLRETNSGRKLFELPSPDDSIHSAVFSLNGKFILTAGYGIAQVWETTTGRNVAKLLHFKTDPDHQQPIKTIAISPDGRLVITTDPDAARLWQVPIDAKETQLLEKSRELREQDWEGGQERPVWNAKFSPDGTLIVVLGPVSARLWRVSAAPGGEVSVTTQSSYILTHNGARINSADFSPDSKSVVTASNDRTAQIWDTQITPRKVTLGGHRDAVNTAVFSPDGRFVVTASNDRTARVWLAETGEQVSNLVGNNGHVLAAVFSPDSKLIATESDDQTTRLWDSGTNQQTIIVQGGHDFIKASSSPNGRLIALVKDGKLQIMDSLSKLVIYEGAYSLLNEASFSSTSQFVVMANRDSTAAVLDLSTGKSITMRHSLGNFDANVYTAAFSPDDKFIVTTSRGSAWIWSAKTGEKIDQFDRELPTVAGVTDAEFSPDGRRLVIATRLAGAEIWDLRDHQLLTQLATPLNSGLLNSVTFSPDGQFVLGGSDDGVARVWNANTGQRLLTLRGHTARVYSSRFSSDGRFIATASADRTARIWDAFTGRALTVVRGHTDDVLSAEFSPQNKYVLTASKDGTVQIHTSDVDLSIDSLISRAKKRMTRCLRSEEREKYLHERVTDEVEEPCKPGPAPVQ
jgi:WD40 repeat protein